MEGNIYFYKATAYGIVPVPKSVQQQSVQFTTWSCSSSHACDHHVQGVHELVYVEIQDYVTTPKSNWAPQEQCCELSALPIPLQLQVLDLQEPGQSFPSLRYNKPGAYTEIVGLEAHTKNVPVGVCDHWPTEQGNHQWNQYHRTWVSCRQNYCSFSQAGTPYERKILTAADFTRVKGTNPALTDGLHRNTPIVKRQKIKGVFNHAKTLTDCSARGWYLECMSCNNS